MEALTIRDISLRRIIFQTLAKADRSITHQEMLGLGQQKRYADVLDFAQEAHWHGDDMARLLGLIVQAPDRTLRREALRLLAQSGKAAAPAFDDAVTALRDADPENRYQAALTVEANLVSTPRVITSLRACLEDDNGMVVNVARRALAKIEPQSVPPTKPNEAK